MKYSGPVPHTCTKCDYYKRLISEYCERITMSNLDKLKNATPRSLRSMTKQEMEDLFSFSVIDFDRDCQHQSLDGTKEDLKWIPIAVVCVVSWWWPSDGPSPTSSMVSSS